MNFKKSGKSTVSTVERAEQILINKGYTVSTTKVFGSSFAEYSLVTEEKNRIAVVNEIDGSAKIQYYDVSKD